MTEKERMLSGKLYIATDEELVAARSAARRLTSRYNATDEDWAERRAILQELLGGMGEDVYIEPTFRCDYGSNIHLGDRVFANFDCVILDVAEVRIGNDVLLGPRVCIYAAGHPTDAGVRAAGLEFGRPVTIADKVWVGGNCILSPGVSVGEGSIIGAGSVVTRDIPAGVLAAGAPCRVIRELTDADTLRWQAEENEYYREHPWITRE